MIRVGNADSDYFFNMRVCHDGLPGCFAQTWHATSLHCRVFAIPEGTKSPGKLRYGCFPGLFIFTESELCGLRF